ncbi:hypothetical protein DFH07DRAFT_286422 [Mycena maculata]|uniref:Cell wall galactomannoprotein n=1 Tax=Mycena maculata TaxID=230809 RepID=A0AAD7MMA4_9AGAR|nr:hypothetical protein DFH07DRAFT_286422 [Mycena maculata]
MARIYSIVSLLCIAACTVAAPLQLAPMHRRQTGDLQCNLARLKIIADISSASALIGQINSTDLSTATSVAVAQTGLESVNDAIQTILAAVFTNQTAPAASRDQVSAGLDQALYALNNITDPSVNATVAAAQAKIESAGIDGDNVVDDCH